MIIQNHRLEGAPFIESPNRGGTLAPEVLVLHYTVSWPVDAVVRAFKNSLTRASAHLVLDFNGTFTQMVPFNRQAWHAGVSSWRGRERLNHWSLGIEIVNPGPVFPDGTKVKDVNGRAWTGSYAPRPADPALWPKSCPPSWKHWALYPEAQLVTLEEVCRLLVAQYGLREIVAHSDVAPGRKFDPGPVFPMERIRAAAFRKDSPLAPAIDPATLPQLSKGPKSAATAHHVALAQQRLNAHGATPPLDDDGWFGEKTRLATLDFQKRMGVGGETGAIGPLTWSLLLADP